MTIAYDRARLIALFQRDALRLGTFKLSSGRTSHYYVDGRKVTLSAEGAALIGAGIWHVINAGLTNGLGPVNSIGGLSLGADPVVTATLTAFGSHRDWLRGFLVRKEPKSHGTGQLIEGPFRDGDCVVIMDDVATTGGSLLQAADAVLAAGGTIVKAVVVLDRLEGAREACERRGIGLESLFTIRDLGVEPLEAGRADMIYSEPFAKVIPDERLKDFQSETAIIYEFIPGNYIPTLEQAKALASAAWASLKRWNELRTKQEGAAGRTNVMSKTTRQFDCFVVQPHGLDRVTTDRTYDEVLAWSANPSDREDLAAVMAEAKPGTYYYTRRFIVVCTS